MFGVSDSRTTTLSCWQLLPGGSAVTLPSSWTVRCGPERHPSCSGPPALSALALLACSLVPLPRIATFSASWYIRCKKVQAATKAELVSGHQFQVWGKET